MSVYLQEICVGPSLEDIDDTNSELDQVDYNTSVGSKQLAEPVNFESKGECSGGFTVHQDSIEEIPQDDHILKRRISEDYCEPFLHIDIKEEYSVDDVSLQEQDLLTVSPNVTLRSSLHTGVKHIKCATCSKSFRQKSSLTRHYRIHTGDNKPYKCVTCSQLFSDKSSLTKHSQTHIADTQFKFATSSKAFIDLTTHRLHTGDKLFQCVICSRAFNKKSNLTKHSRTHTGDKPFKCTACSKAFSDKCNLTTHSRLHTGDKSFKCAMCSKAFSKKSNLTMHCRMHTGDKPFECAVCRKTFSEKSTLTKHCRVHTGDKPYKCATCSKTFSQKSNLEIHCRMHTGDKPFICTVCFKTFTKKSNLLSHSRIHT